MINTVRFIPENDVYQILSAQGIPVPRHMFYRGESLISKWIFQEGDPIVIKGIAENLWHKSDAGALRFAAYSDSTIRKAHEEIQATLKPHYHYLGTLVCEQIPFKSAPQLPAEAFVSIHRDTTCGVVIYFGVGGLLAEK